MNKKTQKKLTRQKRIWEYNVAKRKRTEREIAAMEREVEKIQNSTPQAIRSSNKKELTREENSRKPKEKTIIEDTRAYRKKRAKTRRN
jgi:hypothetical protein